MKKKLIPLLIALLLLLSLVPATAYAKASTSEEAYLMYADASWTNQYWGTDVEGVKATTAKIKGSGDYKVGLDFTGTADGAASGIAFTAVGIKTGEFTYPGATIELKSVKINGADVTFTKGYTSSDDGITTRMNIYNEWVTELPYDARSFDGDISTSSAIVVDKAAFESVKTIEITFTLHEAKDVAYLMYADSSWTYQYMGSDVDTGVKATNATITGPGEYTVGLDFTETADGAASGVAFSAVGIANGEQIFPNYCITIKDIKVNGESIAFTKGYTSSDEGITTRMNIFNEWVTALPADARSYDGVTEDSGWVIIDKEAFASVKTVEVTFAYAIPEAHAYIMYADAAWAYQYWGEPVDTGVVATDATVTGAGSYKVGLDFTGTADGAATDIAFSALGLKGAEKTHAGWYIRIDSITVNGEAVEFKKGYTSSDDGLETRMNIYNEWVTELPADARSYDKNLDEVGWMIVDKAVFASVKTIEIEFTYIRGEAPKADTKLEIDVEAALGADYNAYFGIQTDTYIFRNAWSEPNYGKETDNWTHLTGWDADNNQVDYGGTFTDAVISGNGTYTVGVSLGDMGLGTDETLRMLFISTDIPSQLFTDGLLTITDFSTSFDGGKGQSAFTVNTDGDYAQIDILNEYTSTGAEAIPYTMPTKDIVITFTIAGFSKDSATPPPAETPEPTPAVTETTAPPASTMSPGMIAAIAGGAVLVIGIIIVIIVVSSKKKKQAN